MELGKNAFDLVVECGKCNKKIQVTKDSELLKFTLCGCPNRARICLQNKRELAHLIGGEDESQTFVHVHVGSKITLPKMTLVRWNLLQHRFKINGSVLKSKSKSKPATKIVEPIPDLV